MPGGLDALRDADVLSRTRRAFHTLKGSSRMVGLNRYGEAAWAIEQVMNLWIAEAREPMPALLALLHHAHDLLREWAVALQADAGTQRDIAALVAEAQAVREPGQADLSADAAPPRRKMPLDSLDALLAHARANAPGQAPPRRSRSPLSSRWPRPRTATCCRSASRAGLASDDDHYKVIGPVRIGLALYNVYLQEADDLVRQFATDLSEWKHENHPCPSELALRAAHTLQGSASTVGLEPVRDIAEALEQLLLLLGRHPVVMHPGDFRLLDAGRGGGCARCCTSLPPGSGPMPTRRCAAT